MTLKELMDELAAVIAHHPDAAALPVVTPPDAVAFPWGVKRDVTGASYILGKGTVILSV